MSHLNWIQRNYWSRLTKPAEERALFRFLLEKPISSITEIGIGDGSRMQRIAKLVQLDAGTEQLRYIGVDEFELSQERPFLSLKQAHKLASHLGFRASLVPGVISNCLPRVAHKFSPSDLVIIDGGLDIDFPMTGPIGSWLNRIAHTDSTVLASQQPGQELQIIDPTKLELPIEKTWRQAA